MRYLEQELQYMNENLVQENFNRFHASFMLIESIVINFFALRHLMTLCHCFSSHVQSPDSFVE